MIQLKPSQENPAEHILGLKLVVVFLVIVVVVAVVVVEVVVIVVVVGVIVVVVETNLIISPQSEDKDAKDPIEKRIW